MSDGINKPAGVAEMSKDGILKIRIYGAPKGADTQIINPDDQYYSKFVESIGS